MPITDAEAAALDASRRRTHLLFDALDEALVARPPAPYMSPPVWDLGHIAAYEELWVAERVGGLVSCHPDLQTVYDAFETPRPARVDAPLLDRDACRAYLADVRARTHDVLATSDLGPDGPPLTRDGFVVGLVVEHEAQHTETVLQALKLLPPGSYAPPGRRPPPRAPVVPHADRVEIAGGRGEIGFGAPGFSYDCERPRHEVFVAPFALDRFPATNARHIAFIDDGGYARPGLWSAEGWEWRTAENVQAPLYWIRDGDLFLVHDYEGIVPVDPDAPVCHVSWYEAQAHARWAGGRLPTEAEWECAASWGADRPQAPWGEAGHEGRANLDQLGFGPHPVGSHPSGRAPSGCEQMLGDVWEWTATEFGGYPGFSPFPYREYSEVFFGGGYRVLRGGSWATQPPAARTTFRNWDHPYRRQIFAGFRLAWDLA